MSDELSRTLNEARARAVARCEAASTRAWAAVHAKQRAQLSRTPVIRPDPYSARGRAQIEIEAAARWLYNEDPELDFLVYPPGHLSWDDASPERRIEERRRAEDLLSRIANA